MENKELEKRRETTRRGRERVEKREERRQAKREDEGREKREGRRDKRITKRYVLLNPQSPTGWNLTRGSFSVSDLKRGMRESSEKEIAWASEGAITRSRREGRMGCISQPETER